MCLFPYSVIQLSVQFHAHQAMNQTQLVMVVFQCISVSSMIPVRMEQHVILVITATLTTPAHVLELFQETTSAYLYRMEQHVISVLTATLTTPALVYLHSLGKIAVSIIIT